jgi:hypothetical protein
MGRLNKALFTASAILVAAAGAANAETVNLMGKVPTAEELVGALTPPEPEPVIKFRGVRPTSASATAAPEGRRRS